MSAALLNQDFGSESEGEEFNPAPADDSDNEAGNDVDGEGPPTANGHKKNPGATDNVDGNGKSDAVDDNGQEEDEEDGDEDVDDDSEEEGIRSRPRKRAKRDPRMQYLDVEAEVDEEDEGDEDEEEGHRDGFIADTHPDDLVDLPDGTENDDRRHRELDRQRERADQLSAEKQAELLREKYGRRQTTTGDAVHVPKRLLLPSVEDPSIWGVKCKPGKEREVVFSITKRVEDRIGTKDPMPLISAFERGGTMLGYVYIEARKQADVLKALDGIMNVYPRTKIVLVPIKEMPDLLRVTKSEQLQPGSYVRLKRGKYGGDLAQIEDVETNGLEATLRIVPRLDYGVNDDAPMVDGGIRGEAAKRKRAAALGLNNAAVRPPPRLFSENEAKKHHSRFLASTGNMDRKTWQYMGDTYVSGFLIKDFKIQHLITENVNPQLEEVTRFTAGAEDGAENLDLTALAATLKKTTAVDSYLPGDMVEVYEGEQSGVSGKAVAVRGDIVTIAVTTGDLKGQSIEVPMKGLRKRFSEGDHVKVIGGSRYKDEVGMVVSIKNDTVTMLSDLSMQEITVFSKDLREASDSGVAGGLGRYDIHDLVQLDPATVGCITKVDRESMRVLDQNGSLRSVMPSQVSNKIERRKNAVATDRNGAEIRTDDTVREIGGESKQGVIIHIHRSYLFLHNREQTENSGLSVVRASNVATVAAKGGRVAQAGSIGPDLNKMNPAMMRNGANGNTAMAPPKSFGRDRAIDQTVTIRRGAHKGLLGIVKDTTDTEARVELHTKSKTIQVPKEFLGFKNALTGQSMDYASFAGSRGRGGGGRGGFAGGATPRAQPDWSGGRTPLPMGGGRTPAWGGATQSARTPAWTGGSSSARTPAWNQGSTGGSRTPAYASNDGSRTVNPYNDGSRTAYGGATAYGGSRTPAWNPTATASSYTHDPFSNTSSSSSLPNAGSRTPAYSHPTPSARPYDAPTPGKDFASAPTPAARPYDAPTPAAASAATPATPATPAASGLAAAASSSLSSGRAYDAPTPAAANGYGGYGGYSNAASTPGAGMAAPTPKFSGDAPTPFSGLPETPGFGVGSGGMGGEDEDGGGGPRYEEGTPSP